MSRRQRGDYHFLLPEGGLTGAGVPDCPAEDLNTIILNPGMSLDVFSGDVLVPGSDHKVRSIGARLLSRNGTRKSAGAA